MKEAYRQTKIACYLGYITQAININLMPLFFVIFYQDFGVSMEKLGALVLIIFGVQLVADALSAPLLERLGYRKSAVLAHLLSAVGLVLLSILPHYMDPYAGILISALVFSLGSAIVEVIISPLMERLPGEAKKSDMALLHSFYCWGQLLTVLLTTLILWCAGKAVWYLLPPMWAIAPLFNAWFFTRVPLPEQAIAEAKAPLAGILKKSGFWAAIILMMCAGASELAMSQWASFFAEKGLGVSKVAGDLLGPCLFALFMGLGRTWYGLFGEKRSIKNTLLVLSVFCILCYLTAALSPFPILALLGCALCGLSVSLMWPGTISLTASRFPKGGTSMFALLALGGDLGGSLGPYLTGLVSGRVMKSPSLLASLSRYGQSAEQLGLKVGLLAMTVFPVLMFVTLILMKKAKKK